MGAEKQRRRTRVSHKSSQRRLPTETGEERGGEINWKSQTESEFYSDRNQFLRASEWAEGNNQSEVFKVRPRCDDKAAPRPLIGPAKVVVGHSGRAGPGLGMKGMPEGKLKSLLGAPPPHARSGNNNFPAITEDAGADNWIHIFWSEHSNICITIPRSLSSRPPLSRRGVAPRLIHPSWAQESARPGREVV